MNNLIKFETPESSSDLMTTMELISSMANAAMSDFKINNFALPAKDFPSPSGVMVQSIVEVSSRTDRIKLLQFEVRDKSLDLELADCDLNEILKNENISDARKDILSKKTVLKKEQIGHSINRDLSRIKNFEDEAKSFIGIINKIIPTIPDQFISEDGSLDIDKLEINHWEAKLGRPLELKEE